MFTDPRVASMENRYTGLLPYCSAMGWAIKHPHWTRSITLAVEFSDIEDSTVIGHSSYEMNRMLDGKGRALALLQRKRDHNSELLQPPEDFNCSISWPEAYDTELTKEATACSPQRTKTCIPCLHSTDRLSSQYPDLWALIHCKSQQMLFQPSEYTWTCMLSITSSVLGSNLEDHQGHWMAMERGQHLVTEMQMHVARALHLRDQPSEWFLESLVYPGDHADARNPPS